MAELWVYGDTTTKVTDGNMQEYVSKYLTQHSEFPRVLDKFPQRSFHSILLGSKDRKEVRELLKARDFETLTTDYVINKKGVSGLSRYFPAVYTVSNQSRYVPPATAILFSML